MSLLLDALKKAAEKNAQKDTADKTTIDDNKTRVDLTETLSSDELDATVAGEFAEQTEMHQADEDDIEAGAEESVEEGITQIELAKIIKQGKKKNDDTPPANNATEDKTSVIIDETVIQNEENAVEDIQDDDEYIAQSEIEAEILEPEVLEQSLDSDDVKSIDDDPSLKLAVEDEAIELTDDDVTAFLGGDDFYGADALSLEESEFSLEDNTTRSKYFDKTDSRSLNLVDQPDSLDTSILGVNAENTSTTGGFGHATNLNTLTNDSTFNAQDSTSVSTIKNFAADNYDRTLVKLDGDDSKVFSGMNANKPGEAMTPDFAKKVFVSKSNSLRKQHFKLYFVIAFILLASISLFALVEMQTQMEEIDTGLVRLKRNPIPMELRLKTSKANNEQTVLNGHVDTEALKLLKSMTEKVNESAQIKQPIEADISTQQQPEKEQEAASTEQEEMLAKIGSDEVKPQPVAVQKVKTQPKAKSAPIKKAEKKKSESISIKANIKEREESLLLKSAYSAYEKGDLSLAAEHYQKVLVIDAENRDALLGQAAIYAAQNKEAKAIENYQKILLLNPKDALAMTSLIAASSLSPIESESRLKSMQREAPEATYLTFAIGNVISAQNRWQEAQQYYFMAYQAEPTNPDYAYNLGVSLEQINKPDVAVNYYQQALVNAQTSPAAFNEVLIEERIEVLTRK